MQRRSVLYLFVALGLLLAPMAAYAAPTPTGFDAAGSNVGTVQPAAPANEAKPKTPPVPCWTMSRSAA